MAILWASLIVVGIAVFLLCFNIIFRNKPFPDGEIGRNKELRKRGVICAKEEEMKIWKNKKKACSTCTEDCSIRNIIKDKNELGSNSRSPECR